VSGDVARLSQVFLQLLVNAAQAIPEGAPQQHQVVVRTRPTADGRVAVEIEDSGVGIPAEKLPHIFEPFFTTRDVGEGSGLGLSICHGVIGHLGGEIALTSTLGEGSCVRVVLPALADGSRDGFGAEVARRVVATRPARVLVVDADHQAASHIASVLGQRYDVTTAASGREALELLRRERDFDAVVCDLVMPEMDGIGLYETVGTLRPELRDRFLFLVAGALGELSREARDWIARAGVRCLRKSEVTDGAVGALKSLLRTADTEDTIPPPLTGVASTPKT
jgi:two-component system NtrC family sensor kinase